MKRAIKRVIRNDGAPGVDGMTVRQLKGYMKHHGPKIRQALLDGTYDPLPVRRKEIDKPDGGVRLLGIPCVLDRVVQQAVAQVLTALWDHTFSDSSFGFRPKRSQAQALRRCQDYLRQGYRFVVDLDLAKFFDTVPQDRLLSRLATRIKDKRVLGLIRRFLQSGVMIGGLVSPTMEGTPQGGPLSPLLSNIVLDELDQELEKRGLHFVRYADDCVIYVRSKRAGERVMEAVTRFVTRKLKLQVNQQKSAVGRPWDRKYLGCCFTNHRAAPKLRLHWKTVKRFREKVREITGRKRGRSLQQVINELNAYTGGWWNYFGIVESRNRLRPLDHWIRRRLRAVIWTHWKNRRTRVTELLKRGVYHDYALTTGCARKGAWRMSGAKWVHIALPDSYFRSLGLVFPWLDPA
ncbi:MAG: group II intron reverse transcriptase/maturase [Lentisphaeria bacterium]|nr:group II intron reverse transcriptase/maturase [Lentisphaeria bacterium]